MIIGALVAFQPAYDLAQAAGDGISEFLSRWGQIELPTDHRILGIGLLAAILGPLLVAMLEE